MVKIMFFIKLQGNVNGNRKVVHKRTISYRIYFVKSQNTIVLRECQRSSLFKSLVYVNPTPLDLNPR